MKNTIPLADGVTLRSFPASGDTGRTAAILVLPGGGYAGLAEHEGTPVAQWLSRRTWTGPRDGPFSRSLDRRLRRLPT